MYTPGFLPANVSLSVVGKPLRSWTWTVTTCNSTTITYDVPSSLIGVENSSVPFLIQTESEGLEALKKNALVLDVCVDTLIKGAFARAVEMTRMKL